MLIKEYVPYTKNIEVIEHRAPTDDSIRLYKELEEKAERNLVRKETFNENILNGLVCCFEYGASFDNLTAHIRFNLNGKDYHEVIEMRRSFLDRDRLRQMLYTAIMSELAKTFIVELEKIKV